jgi:hypothetical protein
VKSNGKAIISTLMIVGMAAATALYGQAVKSRRDAYGVERAGQVEALLHALFPHARVEWDPVLAIRQGSGPAMPVDVGNFVATRGDDGSLNGVTSLELGTAKASHIDKIKKFQSSDGQAFDTTMVAFRLPPSGHPMELKKVALDPYEPLTKITWFEVKSWPSAGWPVLRLRYESYTYSADSLTAIEWDSILDMATGAFAGRIPAGILTLHKDAEREEEVLSSHRTGPGQVEILGAATKKVISYHCGDPCVVDGPTFLAQWAR